MRRPKHGGESGFTLIELLGVTAILGVISAVAILALGSFFSSSSSATCSADAKALATAEDTAFAAQGEYVTEDVLVSSGYMHGPIGSYDITVDGGSKYSIVSTGSCASAASVGVTTIPTTSTTTTTVPIDKTPPSVLSITRADPSPTKASSIRWTVSFSESVTGVNAADFTLVPGGGVGGTPAITDVSGGGTQYIVTVTTTGTTNGTLGLNLVDDDSIKDTAGNRLGGLGTGNGNATGELYTIDHTAPTVSSINRVGAASTNASTVQWTVTFSESVTGVDTSDFALVKGGGLGGAPAITDLSGSGSTYTVTASTGSGSGTLGLNLVDDDTIKDLADTALAGGGSGNFTGQVFTIDLTAPTLTSMQMLDTDTDGKVDRVTATFSETLSTADAAGSSQWSLANVPSNGTLSSVSISGQTATVNINQGSGARDTAVGSFTLALASAGNGIRDTAGNPASFGATAPNDGAAPIPISIASGGGTAGRAEAGDTVTITFSEPVAPTASSSTVTLSTSSGNGKDVNLNLTGLVNGAFQIGKKDDYLTGNSGTSAVFNNSAISQPTTSQVRVTLGTWSGAGSLSTGNLVAANTSPLSPAAGIKDVAGNAATGSLPATIRFFSGTRQNERCGSAARIRRR